MKGLRSALARAVLGRLVVADVALDLLHHHKMSTCMAHRFCMLLKLIKTMVSDMQAFNFCVVFFQALEFSTLGRQGGGHHCQTQLNSKHELI